MPEIIGILFCVPTGTSRKDHVRVWGSRIKALALELGLGPLLAIEGPCGHSVVYDTVDDVPLTDAPCTCGNDRCWFIKYEEAP